MQTPLLILGVLDIGFGMHQLITCYLLVEEGGIIEVAELAFEPRSLQSQSSYLSPQLASMSLLQYCYIFLGGSFVALPIVDPVRPLNCSSVMLHKFKRGYHYGVSCTSFDLFVIWSLAMPSYFLPVLFSHTPFRPHSLPCYASDRVRHAPASEHLYLPFHQPKTLLPLEDASPTHVCAPSSLCSYRFLLKCHFLHQLRGTFHDDSI